MIRVFKRFYDDSDAGLASQSSATFPDLCPAGPFVRTTVAAAPAARPTGLPGDRPTVLRPELSTGSPVDPPADLPDPQNVREHLSAALDHISALEIQLKEKSAAIEESRTEGATVAITYHRLELELQEKCGELLVANETVLATKALFDEAVKICAELSAQIHNLEGNLNDNAKTIEALQVEVEDLKTVSAEAKEQNDKLPSTIDKAVQKRCGELAARTAQLETQITQKKSESLDQHLKFTALEIELANKNHEIELARLEIERLKASSTSAQDENGKLTKAKDHTIVCLEGELRSERSRNSDAQGIVEELCRELTMLLPRTSTRPLLMGSTENDKPRQSGIAA